MNRPLPPQGEQTPQAEATDRKMVSLRLSRQARQILERLARQQGISQAAVLEVLLRREAAATALPQQAPNATDPSSPQ